MSVNLAAWDALMVAEHKWRRSPEGRAEMARQNNKLLRQWGEEYARIFNAVGDRGDAR